MAAIAPAGCTLFNQIPGEGKKMMMIATPATADSADTLDVATLGFTTVNAVFVYDETTGDTVTGTLAGTVITIDAAGGTANHTYNLIIWGDA